MLGILPEESDRKQGAHWVFGWVPEMNRQAALKAILCLTVLVFRVLRQFWGPTGSFEGISLPVCPEWGNSKTVQPQTQTERDTLERMSRSEQSKLGGI